MWMGARRARGGKLIPLSLEVRELRVERLTIGPFVRIYLCQTANEGASKQRQECVNSLLKSTCLHSLCSPSLCEFTRLKKRRWRLVNRVPHGSVAGARIVHVVL